MAWLPYGPQPQTTMIMRNMLPAAGFAQAIQNAQPGTEARTMGTYYPASRYYATPRSFEHSVGCHPPARAKHPAHRRAKPRHRSEKRRHHHHR